MIPCVRNKVSGDNVIMTLKSCTRTLLITGIAMGCLLNGCKKRKEQAPSTSDPNQTASSSGTTLMQSPAPSVTHGNIKITLIHLARTTSWSNEFSRGHDDRPGAMYAVPGVYMEFVVEQLDEVSTKCELTGITTKLLQNDRLISVSMTLGVASVNANYSIQSQRFGFKPPEVKDERKALILRHYMRGVALDSGQVTIRVNASIIDDELQMFVFKDIPLY